MNIDIPKLVYIYVIILALMYIFVIRGNIVKDVSSFTDRKEEDKASIKLETDYDGEKYSRIYIEYFIANLNKMNENELKTYFLEDYYLNYSDSIKSTLSKKARIRKTNENYSYIEFVKKGKNSSGNNVYVYNIMVMKKGLEYPDGYTALVEEDSIDKNKNVDIYVVEISPYNYVLQVPEKEFAG